MPLGPDSTQPVGTDKQQRIKHFCEVIDYRISKSENSTLELGFSWMDHGRCWDIENEIADIYQKAGWPYVYWKRGRCDETNEYLVLSKDPNHVVNTRYSWDDRSNISLWKQFCNLFSSK